MNTYLKYQPPGMQFMAFMGFAAGFFLITYFNKCVFFADIGVVLQDTTAQYYSGNDQSV